MLVLRFVLKQHILIPNIKQGSKIFETYHIFSNILCDNASFTINTCNKGVATAHIARLMATHASCCGGGLLFGAAPEWPAF